MLSAVFLSRECIFAFVRITRFFLSDSILYIKTDRRTNNDLFIDNKIKTSKHNVNEYSAVPLYDYHFLPNPNKIHPIARTLGKLWGVICSLTLWHLEYYLKTGASFTNMV